MQLHILIAHFIDIFGYGLLHLQQIRGFYVLIYRMCQKNSSGPLLDILSVRQSNGLRTFRKCLTICRLGLNMELLGLLAVMMKNGVCGLK